MTQERVARTLEWSTAKVNRIERGRSPLTKTDLQVLLALYGVTDETESGRLQDLARGAKLPAWAQVHKGDISDSYRAYIGYEAGASTIRQVQLSVIPGLLQTDRYARACCTEILEDADTELEVELRVRRQHELNQRPQPPRQLFILDEAVIRRHVGFSTDPEIMPDQLRHLVRAGRSNHIQIGVLPFGAGAHAGMRGPFTILDFDANLSGVLSLEGQGTPTVVTGEDQRVSDYRHTFELLRNKILSRDNSLALIQDLVDEMSH